MKTETILRVSALSCAVSVLAFFVLAALYIPLNFADPVYEILAGQIAPGTDIYNQYVAIVPAAYTVDDVFIIGWIVGGVGVSMLVSKQNRLLGSIVLVLGMAGPILDFLENEISWTLIDISRSSTQVPIGWYVSWCVVRQMSFIIPYATAALVGICLWSRQTLGRVATGMGTIGVVIAITGMYMPALWIIGILWWPAWFIALGLLLWQESKNWEREEAVVNH